MKGEHYDEGYDRTYTIKAKDKKGEENEKRKKVIFYQYCFCFTIPVALGNCLSK
jgi:hypothetical protein